MAQGSEPFFSLSPSHPKLGRNDCCPTTEGLVHREKPLTLSELGSVYVNLSRTCRQALLLTAVSWLVNQMCHASPDCLLLAAEACSSLLWGVSGGMLRDHLAASRQPSVVFSLPGVTAWQPIEWYQNHSPSSRPTGEEALLFDHCAEWHQGPSHSSRLTV